MTEIVLNNRKNGMFMMLFFIMLYVIAFLMLILGVAISPVVFLFGLIWVCVGWIPFLGLKIVRPQEALVLTLFGKYIGTLKDEGFYWVNPFCVAVNPAAKTKLNQSGDVDTGSGNALAAAFTGKNNMAETVS